LIEKLNTILNHLSYSKNRVTSPISALYDLSEESITDERRRLAYKLMDNLVEEKLVNTEDYCIEYDDVPGVSILPSWGKYYTLTEEGKKVVENGGLKTGEKSAKDYGKIMELIGRLIGGIGSSMTS
jgi:hypothetical protein